MRRTAFIILILFAVMRPAFASATESHNGDDAANAASSTASEADNGDHNESADASAPKKHNLVTTTFIHLGNDIRYSFAYWPAFVILGGGIAAAELTQVDQKVANHYRSHGSDLGKFDSVAGMVGNWYVIDTASALEFGIAELVHAKKAALTGESLVESLFLTEMSTGALKLAFHRTRPNGGTYGFPSAHAARCFDVAAVIETLHGPAAGIPAFLAAAAIGFSRIDSNVHNVSDVVFGAAWGTAIGWGTAWFHKRHYENLAIYPMMNGGHGLEVAYRF